MAVEKVGNTWRYRIRKRKNGRIIFEHSKSGFRTKREAEYAAKKIELDFENGINLQSANTKFSDFFEHWVMLYKIGTGSLRTDEFRKNAIRKAAVLFEDVKLKDISKDYYQQKINELAKNLSKATVKKYHNYFKGCLEHAFEQQIITYNPARNIVLKGNDKNTKKIDDKFLNYTDSLKLQTALLDDTYTPLNASRNACIIALETGMRFGEILALTWDKIDFKNQTIKIDRSWDYVHSNGFIPTKTKNVRTIAISKMLVDFLKNIKNECQYTEFVLADNPKNLISNNAVNKSLARACKRAKIKTVTLHNLRHTHGSILLYKGFSILYISKRLGHASVSITQDVYLHLLSELQDEYDNKIKNNIKNDLVP